MLVLPGKAATVLFSRYIEPLPYAPYNKDLTAAFVRGTFRQTQRYSENALQ
uniref:Uncharacterized protein n=1 Tax=Thermosporothrix sp. COM3 TaxID=2490863 RepID=A0A455SUK5_9CHLR|nr:hypothetical protein KTC_53430 [Thermosporothrix sp. COM3]